MAVVLGAVVTDADAGRTTATAAEAPGAVATDAAAGRAGVAAASATGTVPAVALTGFVAAAPAVAAGATATEPVTGFVLAPVAVAPASTSTVAPTGFVDAAEAVAVGVVEPAADPARMTSADAVAVGTVATAADPESTTVAPAVAAGVVVTVAEASWVTDVVSAGRNAGAPQTTNSSSRSESVVPAGYVAAGRAGSPPISPPRLVGQDAGVTVNVQEVRFSVSPSLTVFDAVSDAVHRQLPAVEASQHEMSEIVSVPADHDDHDGVLDSEMTPDDAAPNVAACRVVSADAFDVPAAPGSPVCNDVDRGRRRVTGAGAAARMVFARCSPGRRLRVPSAVLLLLSGAGLDDLGPGLDGDLDVGLVHVRPSAAICCGYISWVSTYVFWCPTWMPVWTWTGNPSARARKQNVTSSPTTCASVPGARSPGTTDRPG